MRKAVLLAAVWFLSLAPASRAMDPDTCIDYHWWGRLDYLNWRVKNTPVPALVTFGNPISDGILGEPGTFVMVGDSIGYDPMEGARLVTGLWFDPSATIGFEGSGFFLGKQTQQQSFLGYMRGFPVYSIPFQSTSGEQDAEFISNNASNAGGIFVTSSLSFYGGSADLILACRSSCGEGQFLFGFQSLYLREDLTEQSFTTPFFVPQSTIFRTDHFQTRNFFYGGDVGLRGIWRGDVCFLEATTKLGIGNNFQVVNVSGITNTVASNGAVTTTPGGIFAQTNSIGRFTRNAFCLVPEAQVRVGLELSSALKFSLGYDFVLMTSVVRPGDQIDTTIGPVANQPSHPVFSDASIRTSTFYAHGLSVGLELRF